MNNSNQIFRFVLSFLLSVSASYLTLTSTSTTVRLQCLSKRSAGTSHDVVSHAGVAGASSCVLLYRGRFSWYSAHVRCHMQGLALADLSKYPFTQIEIGSNSWLTNGPPWLRYERDELATECYMTSAYTKSHTDCSEQKDDVQFACAPFNVNASGNTAGQGGQQAIDSESSSHMHPDANKRVKVLSCPTNWTMMKLGDQMLSSCIKEINITDSLNSYSTRPLTWIQTQRICVKQGGHLFWADDDLELLWFLNYLKELEEKIAKIITFETGGSFFLHLDLHKQLYCENEWCWRSKLSIQNSSLIRWFENQPNNSAKFDCAYYKYIRNNQYMKDNNGLHNIPCESIFELFNNMLNKYPYQHILCKKELVHNSKFSLNYIKIQSSDSEQILLITISIAVVVVFLVIFVYLVIVVVCFLIRARLCHKSGPHVYETPGTNRNPPNQTQTQPTDAINERFSAEDVYQSLEYDAYALVPPPTHVPVSDAPGLRARASSRMSTIAAAPH